METIDEEIMLALIQGEIPDKQAKALLQTIQKNKQLQTSFEALQTTHQQLSKAVKIEDENWKMNPDRRQKLLKKLATPHKKNKNTIVKKTPPKLLNSQQLSIAACIITLLSLLVFHAAQNLKFNKDAVFANTKKEERSFEKIEPSERTILLSAPSSPAEPSKKNTSIASASNIASAPNLDFGETDSFGDGWGAGAGGGEGKDEYKSKKTKEIRGAFLQAIEKKGKKRRQAKNAKQSDLFADELKATPAPMIIAEGNIKAEEEDIFGFSTPSAPSAAPTPKPTTANQITQNHNYQDIAKLNLQRRKATTASYSRNNQDKKYNQTGKKLKIVSKKREKQDYRRDKSNLKKPKFKIKGGRQRINQKIQKTQKELKKENSFRAEPKKQRQQRPHRTSNLNQETQTKDKSHSTFSLHVSDVSFQLAKNALLKGKQPEKNKIRPEEFLNAFDYGDQGVRQKEKVACHIEQALHPFKQQRQLMRVSLSTAALGRSEPLRLTLLLDNSGSMERMDREASVRKAIETLIAQLNPQDKVSLISFAQKSRIIMKNVSGRELPKLLKRIDGLPSEGGTNIEQALKIAEEVALSTQEKNSQSRIILITDGAANLGNADPESLQKKIIKLRQQGIAFDACGVGATHLDDALLEALSRKGDGRYYLLNTPEEADANFAKKLAGSLRPAARNVKVQVHFNPQRVTSYKLLGFEKHRLKKEDFRNDAIDAAEMASKEAGNALYQYAVNPNGQGDIGTVSIRFQDMTTKRMIERSWTIPFQSQPSLLKHAKPSLQLATTAVMLAEKLRQTDAGLVNFNENDYPTILSQIATHYAHDSRVQDLLQMINLTIQHEEFEDF